MSSERQARADASGCDACPLATRRTFLRDAWLGLGGLAAAFGISLPAHALVTDVFRVGNVVATGGTADTRVYPIPAADGAQIDRDAQVILVRWQNAVYAFELSCPHQNTALRWDEPDHRFQCPKHHSQYQPDGQFITGRATRNMDRFGIKRDASGVIVNLDESHHSDEDPTGWANAVVRL